MFIQAAFTVSVLWDEGSIQKTFQDLLPYQKFKRSETGGHKSKNTEEAWNFNEGTKCLKLFLNNNPMILKQDRDVLPESDVTEYILRKDGWITKISDIELMKKLDKSSLLKPGAKLYIFWNGIL